MDRRGKNGEKVTDKRSLGVVHRVANMNSQNVTLSMEAKKRLEYGKGKGQRRIMMISGSPASRRYKGVSWMMDEVEGG
jgi:hypothetical protein